LITIPSLYKSDSVNFHEIRFEKITSYYSTNSCAFENAKRDAEDANRPAGVSHSALARMMPMTKKTACLNNAAHLTGAVSLCCAKKKHRDRMTGGHAMAHRDHTTDDPLSVRHCGTIVPDVLRVRNMLQRAPAGVREVSKKAMWHA
jgi:hypothetical protein